MATTVTLKPNAIDISGSTSGTTTLQATAVAGTTTITLPAATDTLVGKATTDTLTNKTLTSPTITGGALNGTLGATTPSTVAATSITASTTLSVTGTATLTVDASISGLTVGKGGGSATGTTAVGASALQANTSSGVYNTAIGFSAMYSNTSATRNTVVGAQALYTNTTGEYNTAIGMNAMQLTTTGGTNACIGYNSGNAITTGSKNSILGSYNGNQDSLDIRTASNYVVLSDGDGNRAAFWQSGGGWVQKNNSTSWSTFSDQRIKENIVSIEQGLGVISALRPVKFDYIQTGKHEVGFIAQEYEAVLPEQIDRQYGIDDATKELVNDDHILSIQQNLVPYLVSAIQELKTIVDTQAAEIAELKAKVGI